MNKKYWLVSKDSYALLQKQIGYSSTSYEWFLKDYYNKLIYISYDDDREWSHMPYPKYEENYKQFYSDKWFFDHDYTYMGEISIKKTRKEKLKRLNEKSL